MSLTFKYYSKRESFAGSVKSLSARPAGAIYGRGLTACFFLLPLLLPAQEALRNSLAADAAAEATRERLEGLPYTFKTGDFRLLLTSSLDLDWNNNVYTSETDPKSDLIVKPKVRMDLSFPVSQQNLLSVNLGIGYNRYFDHPELSGLQLLSGSDVSFDVFIKDVKIDFHDRFGYTKDSALQPQLAGAATADLATLTNSAGISATWDLEDMTLSGGYDHQNLVSTSGGFNQEDHATESLLARAGLKFNPEITGGVEGTAAFTRYDQMVLNNNAMYSAGVYADCQPGLYFHIQPRIGYTITLFQQTSSSIQTSDLNSWYAGLNIKHQANDFFNYTVDAGHEVQLGIQADAIQDYYFRLGLHFDFIKDLTLSPNFSYEHGIQGAGNIVGNLQETFDYYAVGVSASYAITKKFSTGLNCNTTIRSSTSATREYSQYVVGLQLTYHP